MFIFTTNPEKQIAYFIRPFDEDEIKRKTGLVVNFPDSVIRDSIYLLWSKENMPLAYSCNIQTEVCSDKECLLLNIELFWESTGAFLGFKLPPGLPLTKKDHLPFSEEEYSKLSQILADQYSVLSNYKMEDLVVSEQLPKGVDAVSSATVGDIKNVTVPGAVYTCYQLWQIVHGPIARFVADNTLKIMTPDFASRLIDNGRPADIKWLLKQVESQNISYSGLKQDLLQTLASQNYSISYGILNMLTTEDLNNNVIQHLLLDAYCSSDAVLQAEILKKLSNAEQLDEKLFNYFSENLAGSGTHLLVNCLQLLSKQNKVHPAVKDYVSGLLKSDNWYLANKAWQFVENTAAVSEKSQDLVKQYRSKFR